MVPPLALGTAQFGSDYGATNVLGRPDAKEIDGILESAAHHGIAQLDTAFLYPGSEEAIGQRSAAAGFRIVTKTAKVDHLRGGDVRTLLQTSFDISLKRLTRQRVEALLVHDADDLLGPSGHEVYRFLLECREQAKAGKIGVSVYTSEQVDQLLDSDFALQVVQLPISVLDQRLWRSGHISRLADLGIEVHARSVFLQGLVLADPSRLMPGFKGLEQPIGDLNEDARRLGTGTMQVALSFVKSLPEISYIVVGATSAREVEEIVAAFQCDTGKDLSFERYSVEDADLIDPRRWPHTKAVGPGPLN